MSGTINAHIQLGYKSAAWFTANPTLVLKVGQRVDLEQTGTYKLGDGSTQLSALAFLGGGGGGIEAIEGTPNRTTVTGAGTLADPKVIDIASEYDTAVANAIAAAVAARPITLFKRTTPIVHTGVTGITKVDSKEVTLNSIQQNDILTFRAGTSTPGGISKNFYIYVNHLDQISGATQLALYSVTSSMLKFERTFAFQNTLSQCVITSPATNFSNDVLNVYARTIVSFDFSIPFYFILGVDLGSSANSMIIDYYDLTISRNSIL
jgi:hypothetical protein